MTKHFRGDAGAGLVNRKKNLVQPAHRIHKLVILKLTLQIITRNRKQEVERKLPKLAPFKRKVGNRIFERKEKEKWDEKSRNFMEI